MLSPVVSTASGMELPRYNPLPVMRSAAHSPYGLPIVDNCRTCKLRNESFFCGLSKASLEALEPIKHATSYPEGALVFVEGQVPRGVYILCQGRVKLMTTNSDGKSFILKIAQPG